MTADPADILSEIGRLPVGENEKPVTYSDPNFITMGKIVEKLTDQPLDQTFQEGVTGPLGLQ